MVVAIHWSGIADHAGRSTALTPNMPHCASELRLRRVGAATITEQRSTGRGGAIARGIADDGAECIDYHPARRSGRERAQQSSNIVEPIWMRAYHDRDNRSDVAQSIAAPPYDARSEHQRVRKITQSAARSPRQFACAREYTFSAPIAETYRRALRRQCHCRRFAPAAGICLTWSRRLPCSTLTHWHRCSAEAAVTPSYRYAGNDSSA